MKRRGEGILRMEDAGTSEEDDTDSKDSNIPIDNGHLARNCSIKIITLAVKASVVSILLWLDIVLVFIYQVQIITKCFYEFFYTTDVPNLCDMHYCETHNFHR